MIQSIIDFLDSLPLWASTLLLLGLSLSGAVVVELVVVRLLKQWVRRTETKLDDVVLDSLRWPAAVSIALGGVYVLTLVQGVQTVFTQGQLETFFQAPALSLIVVIWAWGLNDAVNRVVETVSEEGHNYHFAPILSNVWTLLVTVGAAFVLLTFWHIDITPLLGAAGIAGVAVGFAAKDTVANFFGGLALYFDDTYKIGDYVQLDSGVKGTVVRVGIRSTTILTRDEVLVTVPNSVLNASMISNQSAPQRRKRVRVPITVAYGTDIDEFEALVLDLADEESLVLDSPRPRMRFREFGDSALEYELLVWVRSPTRERRCQHNLNRAIYVALAEAGIEIPFQQHDLNIRSVASAPTDVARQLAEDGGRDEGV